MAKKDDGSESKTKVDLLLAILQNNRFSALIIVFCIIFIGFSKVIESGNQIMRSLGIIQTYDVNQASERGRFSWELTEIAWNRLFWMRSYYQCVRLHATATEQAEAWQKLMDGTEKWSSNLVNYYIGLDTYYPGSHKRDTLENRIQPIFASVADDLLKLKYDLPKLDSIAVEKRLNTIGFEIDALNNKLYRFVDQTPSNKKH